MRIVIKIGSSSLTTASGEIDRASIGKLCDEVGTQRGNGNEVMIVTSGAITAGLSPLGLALRRPTDMLTLQAASAVGQSRLLGAYDEALARHKLVGGQILLSPNDFFVRKQYLHARETIGRLLSLGVVPIINENDAVADDEIRWSDNDRLAALVAHALNANLLLLLTDTAGIYTADPRKDESASLVEEIVEVDHELEQAAGASGTDRGSGGMASKLSAARIAAWSGVRTIVAAADRAGVISQAVAGEIGVGTVFQPRSNKLSARKLWIAFAMPSFGRIVVDDGARRALVEGNRSLLAAGVRDVAGDFQADSGVEVADAAGKVFAKGVSSYSASDLRNAAGRQTSELPETLREEVIHRDDLVITTF